MPIHADVKVEEVGWILVYVIGKQATLIRHYTHHRLTLEPPGPAYIRVLHFLLALYVSAFKNVNDKT